MKFENYRKKIGSQFEVARLLGISQQAVNKWEMGKSYPRPIISRKVAELFDISIDELYHSIDESKNK